MIDRVCYGPKNPGRFGLIPVRSGHFGPGHFGPISEMSRFGPVGAGRFGPITKMGRVGPVTFNWCQKWDVSWAPLNVTSLYIRCIDINRARRNI